MGIKINTAEGYMFDMQRVPDHTAAALDAYINDRLQPGGFLSAVLSNDLRRSLELADWQNKANLYAIVSYLHWEAPSNCWGSPKKVTDWLQGKEDVS